MLLKYATFSFQVSEAYLIRVRSVPGPCLLRIKVPLYGEDTDRVRTGYLFETFFKRSKNSG